MPVRLHHIVVDAHDLPGLARFWTQALGWKILSERENEIVIGTDENAPVGMCFMPVPDPKTVKNRVHLDLELPARDPEPLLRIGAQVLSEPGKDDWWVLADPEGNEFCAFPPGQGAPPREPGLVAGVIQFTLDCADPQAQAEWWAGVLGGDLHPAEYGPKLRGAARLPWAEWLFQEVPEPKTVKNRVHWDVTLADPAPDALVALGATVLREPGGDISWWVLADPEGNEFCGFAPRKKG